MLSKVSFVKRVNGFHYRSFPIRNFMRKPVNVQFLQHVRFQHLNTIVPSIQLLSTPSIRYFSTSLQESRNSFQEEIQNTSSFENAVSLITNCKQRSFEENLNVLKLLGHFSTGSILIRQHPLFNIVDDFVHYLDSIVKEQSPNENFSLELSLRGIWALSRLGYVPSDEYPSTLLNFLFSRVFDHLSSLSPSDISLFLRSMGKMKYSITDQQYSSLLPLIHSYKSEFSLVDLIDILWGITRCERVSPTIWKTTEIAEDTQYVKDLFQYTENLVLHFPDSVEALRPGYYANLIYSFTYIHYPNSRSILNSLLRSVCQIFPKCTPLEISVIYRAYVETGVIKKELTDCLKQYIHSRTEEFNGSTSLSLLYSYSRGVKHHQIHLDKDLVISLLDIVYNSIEDYSYLDLTYLIGSYENMKIYPEKNTSFICDQLLPHLSDLSPLHHFHLINFIIHSHINSISSSSIISSLIQTYTSSTLTPSLTNMGICCALLRYSSTNHLPSTTSLTSFLESSFIQNPDCFDARCICQLLLDTSREGLLKETTVIQLIKKFSALCGIPKKVSPIDITYTISSTIPYVKKYNSYLIPITLSLGVSTWCGQNKKNLTPKVISECLFGFAKMGVTPTILLQLFETDFSQRINEFKDNEILSLLKAFAMFNYTNISVINSLYDQLSLIVSTIPNKSTLSFLWCVSKLTPSRKELIQRITSELDRRNLNENEQSNYQNLKSLVLE